MNKSMLEMAEEDKMGRASCILHIIFCYRWILEKEGGNDLVRHKLVNWTSLREISVDFQAINELTPSDGLPRNSCGRTADLHAFVSVFAAKVPSRGKLAGAACPDAT